MTGQLPLAMAARPRADFAHFVLGDNAAAVHSLKQDPGSIFLHGPSGCGKTHLLCARARSEAGALYVPAETISLAGSLQGAETVPWLGIDGVEQLAGDPNAATALLRVLDTRRSHSLPLAVTAHAEAAHLEHLLPDLRTRLMQCSSFRLKPLDDTALEQWLKHRTRQRGLEISDSALRWLLQHQRRDPGHLEGALERLDIAALAAKRGRVSAPFARMVLGSG